MKPVDRQLKDMEKEMKTLKAAFDKLDKKFVKEVRRIDGTTDQAAKWVEKVKNAGYENTDRLVERARRSAIEYANTHVKQLMDEVKKLRRSIADLRGTVSQLG